MLNTRVPVLNPDGSPAMPTTASRARRWVKNGKAKVGGMKSTHSFKNGDYVEYKTNRSAFKGYISANDLYQFFPKKKRPEGVTSKLKA